MGNPALNNNLSNSELSKSINTTIKGRIVIMPIYSASGINGLRPSSPLKNIKLFPGWVSYTYTDERTIESYHEYARTNTQAKSRSGKLPV